MSDTSPSGPKFPGKRTIKEEVLGDGITERIRTTEKYTLSGNELTPENLAKFAAGDPLESLSEDKADWLRDLQAICAATNSEWNGHTVFRAGSDRRGRLIEHVYILASGEILPQEFAPYSGRGWYLARLMQLADRIDRSLGNNQPRDAVAAALDLGSLESELFLKVTSDREFIAGNGSLAGSKDGAQRRAAMYAAIHGEWIEFYRAKEALIGKSRAKAATEKKFGIRRANLNKVLRKQKP